MKRGGQSLLIEAAVVASKVYTTMRSSQKHDMVAGPGEASTSEVATA